MDKVQYISLRKKIKDLGMLKQKPWIGVSTLTVETSIFAGLIYLLCQAERFSLSFWLVQVALGISMFRFFALLHECGHKAMFSSRAMNTVAGLYTSFFCLIPYIPWRNLHLQHHRWVGVIDKDPTQAGLLKLKTSSSAKLRAFRIVWMLCIPVPSMHLIFSVFWSYPFRQWRNSRSNALAGFGSIAVCVLPHVAAVGVLGPKAYMIYIMPMIIFFFFWFEVINFTHHSGLFPFTSDTHPQPIPLHEQDKVSRSSTFSAWFSTMVAYNFNFHTEHHFFPMVAWYHLPKIHEMLKGLPPNPDYADVPLIRYSLQLRKRNPVEIYVDSLPAQGGSKDGI